MITQATGEHVMSSVKSRNNRRAAGSGVATLSYTRRTVPLKLNTWYHATHINRGTMFSVGFVPRLYHSTDRVQFSKWSGVELSWEFGSWKSASWAWELQWERRQPARTWSLEHGSGGISGVGSRYQITTGEDIADWEELVHALLNCRVCGLAIALYLHVISYVTVQYI
jgi:hypothetical protein